MWLLCLSQDISALFFFCSSFAENWFSNSLPLSLCCSTVAFSKSLVSDCNWCPQLIFNLLWLTEELQLLLFIMFCWQFYYFALRSSLQLFPSMKYFFPYIPQQLNSVDCGVYLILYARCFLLKIPMFFSQSNMILTRFKLSILMQSVWVLNMCGGLPWWLEDWLLRTMFFCS